jgi:hypothetical protein
MSGTRVLGDASGLTAVASLSWARAGQPTEKAAANPKSHAAAIGFSRLAVVKLTSRDSELFEYADRAPAPPFTPSGTKYGVSDLS